MVNVTQVSSVILAHALLTNADSAAGFSVKGPEIAVSGGFSADVAVYHALIEAALNDPGIDYTLQGRKSIDDGINKDWVDLWTFTTGTTAAVKVDISGSEAAGETTLAVTSNPTANFTPGVKIYILDTNTLTDSEWGKVAFSETSSDIVTLVDGLTKAKDSSDRLWTQAETFDGSVDITGMSFLRMIIQGSDATGADIHYKAELVVFSEVE